MVEKTVLTEQEEMFLKEVWCLREKQKNNIASLQPIFPQKQWVSLLKTLSESGFIVSSDDSIEFTDKGEACTQAIIRRRRLTELLLYNILNVSLNISTSNACKIEHLISDEVTERICAFLGHPTQCPHGNPIPPGHCCSKHESVRPLIEPLTNFSPGEKGKVIFIAGNDSNRLNRLTSLGVYPGTVLTLRQRKPAAIVRVGETDIALEPSLAKKIYCRTLSKQTCENSSTLNIDTL
ncbi:MAG: metal-dependent transcriptional regulator [Candidatus Brocadiae bacterium]|nr:metal-dependent transcriptional regulator [Candidatus Brocadiia bacterium]